MPLDADNEILQDFLIEAGEILEKLGEQLVELEHSPTDKELLNAVFRGFHTVKGPPQEQISCYEKCGEPKRLVKLPKATHYDCYEFVNPEMSAVVRQEAAAWFRKYL